MYSKKKWVKVMAIILAALFVLSGIAFIFPFFTGAEELATPETTIEEITDAGDTVSGEPVLPENTQEAPPEEVPSEDTPKEPDTDARDIYNACVTEIFAKNLDKTEKLVRVGIFYIYSTTNCLAFSHNLVSSTGFFFYTEYNGEKIYIPSYDGGKITVMRDFSAAADSEGKYYHTTSGNTHKIHHIMTVEPVEPYMLEAKIEELRCLFGENTDVFPVYSAGKIYVAAGSYSSSEEAESAAAAAGEGFVRRIPNNTFISVIDSDSAKILFKIDTAENRLYLRALQTDKDEYLKSSVGNIFDGTFEYSATYDGMALTNVLDIEDYIKSVLPYEISASWHPQALRAFSIVVRSYTLAMFGLVHQNNDFDMCDLTHCQAYRGRLRSTDATDAAVNDTYGMVLAYDGEICRTYYHAISGGATESYKNVWDRSLEIPYLTSIKVPLENYEKYTNGKWRFEVDEDTFFTYLLEDWRIAKKVSSVRNVRISRYTDEGYAYAIEVTDTSGQSGEVLQCDSVRSILSRYAKSSKLTIGKTTQLKINDGEQAVEFDTMNFFYTDKDGNATRFTANYDDDGDPVYKTVLTASGEVTLAPDNEDIYVISGTGWGHGVGMSQYGARDMAEAGYEYAYIAEYFFPGAKIVNIDDVASTVIEDDQKGEKSE